MRIAARSQIDCSLFEMPASALLLIAAAVRRLKEGELIGSPRDDQIGPSIYGTLSRGRLAWRNSLIHKRLEIFSRKIVSKEIDLNVKLLSGFEVLLKEPANDIFDKLQKISIPTLVVWGREDKLIPFEYSQQFVSSIKNCEFMPIEGCGHSPYVEDPERLAEIVNKFFSKHSH